jgi:hypothetical protein
MTFDELTAQAYDEIALEFLALCGAYYDTENETGVVYF